MSRIISEKAAEALENGGYFRQSNTLVQNGELYLHGHEINDHEVYNIKDYQ